MFSAVNQDETFFGLFTKFYFRTFYVRRTNGDSPSHQKSKDSSQMTISSINLSLAAKIGEFVPRI